MSQEIKYAGLPDVRELGEAALTAAKLMDELQAIAVQRKAAEDREDEIKAVLVGLQREAKLPGFQHDGWCFVAHKMPGRKMLNKQLAVERGIDISVLNSCYKTGAPYDQLVFTRVAKT